MEETERLAEQLCGAEQLSPEALVESKQSALRAQGIYAFFFDEIPGVFPSSRRDGRFLGYVGCAPSRPGGASNLKKRLRTHCVGDASRSTLRRSLAPLLSEHLGLIPASANGRLSYGSEGERRLTDWLNRHALISWVVRDAPYEIEGLLIRKLAPPLNIDHVARAERQELTELRKAARMAARAAEQGR